MQKNPSHAYLPWNLSNLTLKNQSLLLQSCAYNRNVQMFKRVLSDENLENKTARHDALKVWNPEILNKDDVFLNMRMYQEISIDDFIKRAVVQSNYNACKVALLCGANVNVQFSDNKYSLLSTALWNNREDIVQLLLSKKDICVNRLPDELNFPLCITSFTGNMKMFSCLFDHPLIDKNGQDCMKKSIVHYMAMSKHIYELSLLLEDDDVMVNVQDLLGNTPLHYAVMNGSDCAVMMFLERKDIDITIKNFLNYTPQDLANRFGCFLIVTLFSMHNIKHS